MGDSCGEQVAENFHRVLIETELDINIERISVLV